VGITRPKLGFALRRGPVDMLVSQARSAQAAGLEAMWIADHIVGFPVDAPVFDPFTALTRLSHEAPNCTLGVAVTDPFRRNPGVLAQTAMTLQCMTGQSLLLGIGAGEAMNHAPYGMAYKRPITRLRDTVLALKALAGSSFSNQVDLEGDGVALHNAYLQQPIGVAAEIFLGTNGPRGRALVGEVADGWLPIMLSPELMAEDVAGIRQSAERAGRDPFAIRIAYHVFFGVADNDDAGLAMVAPAAKAAILGFPRLANRLGHHISTDFDWAALEIATGVAERVGACAALIPDDLVRDVALFGTPDSIAHRIGAFAEAGVTDLILRTINPLDELTDCFTAVARAVTQL
jgi:phthiodiolone/phenolphthiodiolone dimycocerosates ketoreductase